MQGISLSEIIESVYKNVFLTLYKARYIFITNHWCCLGKELLQNARFSKRCGRTFKSSGMLRYAAQSFTAFRYYPSPKHDEPLTEIHGATSQKNVVLKSIPLNLHISDAILCGQNAEIRIARAKGTMQERSGCVAEGRQWIWCNLFQ